MRGRRGGGLAAVVAAVLVLNGAACGDDQGADSGSADTTATSGAGYPAVAAQIKAPAPGTEVQGNVVVLDLSAEGVTIKPADGDTSGRTGHFHVFVDRSPVAFGQVIPTEPGIIHTADNPVTVAGLGVGKHKLAVVIGDGAHRSLSNAPAEIEVSVTGPAVEASTPASVPAGQPVTVEVKASGVKIVAADGDTTGKTGHFHVFVDRPPVAPGQIIPIGDPAIIHTTETSVQLKDLTRGPHEVWVVVGDGVHRALDPAVQAKVTFTVT